MLIQIFFDVAGRLHPALVHLPIGILVIACCFELLSSKQKLAFLTPAIRPMFFWGMVTAILSVCTGLALASGDDYEAGQVGPHKWLGISLAVVSVLLYILHRRNVQQAVIKSFSLISLALVVLTGHLGGSITHGEDYITGAFSESDDATPIKAIPNIQEAKLYNDVVQPMLQSRCYRCHGESKQKGKLRLDNPDLIMKGGKSKKTVITGKADESELIKRLLLPLDDEDHMPPKGKSQLSKEQVSLLQWWVSSGADFQKKVNELPQNDGIKPVLLALQAGSSSQSEEMTDAPSVPVAPADTGVMVKLNRAGVTLLPVTRESNYLMANFVTAGKDAARLANDLLPLKNQLVSLKMDGAAVQDSTIARIAALTSLRRLQLSNTPITDEGVKHLAALRELRSLNLVGTKISARGLVALKGIKSLKHLYLYHTSITEAERAELKKLFPGVQLEFGNYNLPMLATDTTEVKFK